MGFILACSRGLFFLVLGRMIDLWSRATTTSVSGDRFEIHCRRKRHQDIKFLCMRMPEYTISSMRPFRHKIVSSTTYRPVGRIFQLPRSRFPRSVAQSDGPIGIRRWELPPGKLSVTHLHSTVSRQRYLLTFFQTFLVAA